MRRSIGNVRIRNAMLIVTVILFRLQLVIADCTENHQLDPKNDITEHQITEILKIAPIFHKQAVKDPIDEWFSQTKITEWSPIITINSTRISVSKPINESFSVWTIVCYFNSSMKIDFLPNEFINRVVDVQHLNRENIWCSVGSFMLRHEYYGLKITPWDNVAYTIAPYSAMYFREPHNNSKTKYDENVTCNFSTYEKETLYDHVRKILENIINDKLFKDRYTPNVEYQTMFNKCLHPDSEIFDEKHENDYVRFEPYQNMASFPWITDRNELIVKGLNKVSYLSIDLDENNTYDLGFKRIAVRWNNASTEQKQHNIKVYDVLIQRIQDHPVIVEIGLAYDTAALFDITLQQKLEELMASGIEETIEKISHVTSSFTHTINEILQSTDKQRFKNSFITGQDSFRTESISASKTEIETFHLESITCADANLNISKISMKKITGHAEVDFQHSINANQVNRFLVSVDIFIKEATIHISLQQYPNSMEKTVHISPDNPETTIMITSKYHPLNRTERILIGKQIFGGFVDGVRENILKAAKSTFSPILNICNNNRHEYFTTIRDYWATSENQFFYWQTDVTIKGSWNFQQFNIQYENENVIIDGLRIENVTGNIKMKQIFGSNETRMWNYNMSYFLLTINHSDKSIRVQFPAPEEYSIILVYSSDTLLSAQNKDKILERFQYTAASYIEQSIYYNDSSYRAMFRNLINIAITETMKDKSPRYDASSKLVSWLAESLTNRYRMGNLFFPSPAQFQSPEGHSVYVSLPSVKSTIQEMRIEGTSLTEHLTLAWKIDMTSYGLISATIPLEIQINCESNVSNEKYNIDLENIKIDTLQNNITLDDLFKSELEQLLREKLKKGLLLLNFCKLRFGTLDLSEENFYLINDTIAYSSDYFTKYFIRLHGLQNFKSFRNNHTYDVDEFEIVFTNLIANVTWVRNIGAFPSKIPQTMIVKFDQMILTAELLEVSNTLIFTNRSQLQLSDEENPQTVEKLTKTVVPIILKSIQVSILEAYYNYYEF